VRRDGAPQRCHDVRREGLKTGSVRSRSWSLHRVSPEPGWRRGSESNTPEPGGPAPSGFEDRDPRCGKSGKNFAITASIKGDLRVDPKVPPRKFAQISDGWVSDIV